MCAELASIDRENREIVSLDTLLKKLSRNIEKNALYASIVSTFLIKLHSLANCKLQ